MFSNLLADTQLGRSRTQDFYGVHLFLKLVLSSRGPPALAEDKIQSKALNHHRGTQRSPGNKPSKRYTALITGSLGPVNSTLP